MNTITSRPEASAISNPREKSSVAVIAALLLFIAVDLATVPGLIADTLVYAGDILRYSEKGASAPAALWEFGHLLWRPLGYVLWKLTIPVLSPLFAGNPLLEITGVLFGINFVAGAATTLLIFAICRRLGLETVRSFVVTVGFLLCDAILNYVHSGTSYVPGLSLSLMAVWLILKAVGEKPHRALYSVLAGVASALACGFWFPYVLSVPAALWLALVAESPSNDNSFLTSRERIRIVVLAALATMAIGLLIFLGGAAFAHISSLSEFRTWVANSRHGIKVERALVRFPTGITRTFLYFGDDGTILKRFVFGDPYAPVRWTELLETGLWKIALVFVTFCVLFWTLLRTRHGRPALSVVLAGMLPTIGFAILLFEPSQWERYLPFYAALLIGVCEIVRERTARAAHVTLAIFFAIMVTVNLKAFAWDFRSSADASSERFHLVHDHTRHGGVALILSFNDPLSTYFQRSPFNPENQVGALPLYHVIEAELNGVAMWRSGSSCRVLQAWEAGGEAWLSKRLVAPRPEPSWRWSENDVRSTHWVDLYGFFKPLDTDADIGGPDGFLRIARDAKNQAIMQANSGLPSNARSMPCG